MNRGKYIVLEGLQGVGKSSQLTELARRLKAAGLPVRTFREPDSQTDLVARNIRHLTQDPRYDLNTRTEVLLYNAARSQSLEVIRNSVENGVIALVDRNYLTTLAVQYYGRGDVEDYDTINEIIAFAVGDNEPDLTIILDAPVLEVKERIRERYSAERFDNLDEGFMERMRAGYLWEAKQRGLPVVFANKPFEDVASDIWALVSETLAVRKDAKAAAAPVAIKEILQAKAAEGQLPNDENPYIDKFDGQYSITEHGYQYLVEAVTNTTGNVYAFTENISPVTVAAAMARLSRRGDDMRVTILDEFAHSMEKDAQLLQRVITAYGDDSVQQLVGQHVVVENASNLLTKKLEWGRLAAYLEQSTRYIYFDEKDADGKYRYYVPEHFTAEVTETYTRVMDAIFDTYSHIVRELTDFVRAKSKVPKKEQDAAWRAATKAQACDAARPLLPVAVKSTVGIFASGQALESLIMHLLSDELAEARIVGQQLLDEARKTMPTFLERADKPERGGATIAYRSNTAQAVKEFTHKNLKEAYSSSQEAVTLTDIWPRDELDLVPDMLYEHSGSSLTEIREAVADWSEQKKAEALDTYVGERLNRRHRPGRALEKAHYSWDLVCDYGIFRDLQRHRMVDDLEWQQLTPRFGFDVPEIIEEAGLADAFEGCFDLSLRLHSILQAAGYELDAQYATLLGHKMRWKITYNAREAFHFHELRTAPQGHPGYRKLVLEMHQKLAELHPRLAAHMKFVNQDEDPELTRLAGERATQYKLEKLDNQKAA